MATYDEMDAEKAKNEKAAADAAAAQADQERREAIDTEQKAYEDMEQGAREVKEAQAAEEKRRQEARSARDARKNEMDTTRAVNKARKNKEEAEAIDRKVKEDMDQAEADTKAAKQAKFEKEQEDFNFKKKQQYADEKYKAEQAEIVKKNTKEPITAWGVAKKVGGKTKEIVKKAATPDPNASPGPFSKIRERNKIINEYKKNHPERQKAPSAKLKKQSNGQFHAPVAGDKSYIDPFPKGGGKGGGFPAIDPLGGMGGRGRNMLDINFGMPGAGPRTLPRTAAGAGTQTASPPRRVPPAPVKKNPFADPFAGIAKGAGKGKAGANKLMGNAFAKKPKKPIVNPLIGHIKESKQKGKQLQKLDDFLNF